MAVELLRKKAASGVTGESSFEDIGGVVSTQATATATSVATSVAAAAATSAVNSAIPDPTLIYSKNYIINGSMDFWQRNTTLNPVTSGSGTFLADRWNLSNNVTSSVLRADRITDSPNTAFPYCMEMRVVTGVASPSNWARLMHCVEGLDYAAMHGEKNLTLSFWVKSNKIGTYPVLLSNQGSTRLLPLSYTISAVDTWEFKTISFVSDNTGTWDFATNTGLRVGFMLYGSAATPSTGSWIAGSFTTIPGAVSDFFSTANNYIRITGVMLNHGTQAGKFQRAGMYYQTEQRLCERYYEKSYDINTLPGTNTASGAAMVEVMRDGTLTRLIMNGNRFNTTKRAAPTLRFYGETGTSAGSIGSVSQYNASGTAINISSAVGSSTNALSTYLNTATNAVATTNYVAHWTAECEIY